MPKKDSAHVEHVKTHFQSIWPVHLAAFSRLLRHLRTVFDGDLDLVLILAAISERTPREAWESGVEDLTNILMSEDGRQVQKPINIQSVAAYTGIPRETVRRKIERLVAKGWLRRHPDGTISVTGTAAVELEEATGITITYIAEVLAAYDATTGRSP